MTFFCLWVLQFLGLVACGTGPSRGLFSGTVPTLQSSFFLLFFLFLPHLYLGVCFFMYDDGKPDRDCKKETKERENGREKGMCKARYL